jgi:hypothetical protein
VIVCCPLCALPAFAAPFVTSKSAEEGTIFAVPHPILEGGGKYIFQTDPDHLVNSKCQ